MTVGKQPENSSFVAIGKGVYLSKSQAQTARLQPDLQVQQPTVILLFGWMGARLPHLHKYTKVYDELYPDAAKILIRSEPRFFWSTERSNRAALAPVVEALEALGCIPPARKVPLASGGPIQPLLSVSTPRVLAHAFSNGGSWQLTTLGNLLSSRLRPSQISALPEVPSLLILDSAPGSGGVGTAQKAFTGAIRSPILQKIVNVFIAIMFTYSYLMRLLFHKKSIVEVLRATLIRPRVLPWFGMKTRRLYLYSMGDDLVPWQEVEKHAGEAEEAGFIVRKEKFGPSMHVAHARADPERYWSVVREEWKAAAQSAFE